METLPKGKQYTITVETMIGHNVGKSELFGIKKTRIIYVIDIQRDPTQMPLKMASFDITMDRYVGKSMLLPTPRITHAVLWTKIAYGFRLTPKLDRIENTDRGSEALIDVLPRAWKVVPFRITLNWLYRGED